MATLMHSESRRLYSWWWDSHNSPKNSKWLQENLTDMDAKVKAMIKLIEEDADSFARRAEMYYKKRPELMKLVEEFYRAYRALAERYNHATRELRQAHRTMAQAFPDQVPFALTDDTALGSESDTPETPHPIHSFFDPDFQGNSATSLHGTSNGIAKKGLKQLNDLFRCAEDRVEESCVAGAKDKTGQNANEYKSHLPKENQLLKSQIMEESDRASKAETELQALKQALAKLEANRDTIFSQYQLALERLSDLERDLSLSQKHSRSLDKLACEAKTEIQSLKESLKNLEAERDITLLQFRQSAERLIAVEGLLHETQEDSKELSECAAKSELEVQGVEQDLSKLQSEKETLELMYTQCLEEMSALERKRAHCEESLKKIEEQCLVAESEASSLMEEIRKVNLERSTVADQYERSLQTISELQQTLSEAQTENGRLNTIVLSSSVKLKDLEDQCVLLEDLNESLQLEAKSLARKIAAADEEILRKQAELEKYTTSLQEEHSRVVEAEATLHTLESLHSRSQEEQKALALELRDALQRMKELDTCKQDLETEIQVLMDENKTLNDSQSSSSITQQELQEEIWRLRETKERLEAEVRRQIDETGVLNSLVQDLKDEIEGSYKRYHALVKQLESVGIDPKCLKSSVNALQDENLRLKEISEKDRDQREDSLRKLEDMKELLEKNSTLEKSLLVANVELQSSKEKAQSLQESCHGLTEEKTGLIAEKAALISQLRMITETMQNLLEKNTLLQTSLCGANCELEGLREKSKGLEELSQLLTREKCDLLAQRTSLVTRQELVEHKLHKMEMRFTNLEDKYSGLEKEKQSTLSQVEELKISLGIEKQERACLVLTSEARLSCLEGRIHDLKEENKYRKKEFEEQLETAVNAQVEIFILQKFVQDMEDKNYSLLVECRRHIESAQYSEKLITELECENMIQQVEAEFLLDKIDTLRAGINQVLKALDIKHGASAEPEQNFLSLVLTGIRNYQQTLSESKDENEHLLVEKSILSTLLGQLHIACAKLSSRKATLEEESLMFAQQVSILENEKQQLVERSSQLNLEVNKRIKMEKALNADMENLNLSHKQLQEAYFALQDENINTFKQNRTLEVELLHTKEEKSLLEKERGVLLTEALTCSYLSVIFQSYGVDKALELDEALDDMNSLGKAYRELKHVAKGLEERLEAKEMENMALKISKEMLEDNHLELSDFNVDLRLQILNEKELRYKKEKQLADTELKLKVTEDVKTDMSVTIQCLEENNEDLKVSRTILENTIIALSECSSCQVKELAYLREANENLEVEVGKLHEELEECKIREVILTSELHERSSEFELWEAEAASFYFDLQISSIREVLYQSKVHDLGSLCEGLKEVTNRRSIEIEEMKQRVNFLETEAEVLKSQLTTCSPRNTSLKDNVALLEKNPVFQLKLLTVATVEEQGISDLMGESLSCSFGMLDLQKLQPRIKVIEDILSKEKESAAVLEQTNANNRVEAALKDLENLKLQINKNKQEDHRHSARDSVSEMSEVRIGAEMKDIPLDQASGRSFQGTSQRGSATSDDQMLELWEAAEQESNIDHEVQEHGTDTVEDEIVYARSGSLHESGFDPIPESQFEKELGVDKLEVHRSRTQSNRRGNQKNAIERLAADEQKLISLHVSVQEQKRMLVQNKRRKKSEDAECETLRRQLQGAEYSLVQLMDMNDVLKKSIEECSSLSEARMGGETDEAETILQKRVTEQAQKEAEKIGRLELEMQRMKYVSVRLKDEKGSKDGGSRSSTAILLREYFYRRERKSKKQKKSRFCGCLRPSATKS